jgi:hypothetical protein
VASYSLGYWVSLKAGTDNFIFSFGFRSVVKTTQLTIQWVRELFLSEKKSKGGKINLSSLSCAQFASKLGFAFTSWRVWHGTGTIQHFTLFLSSMQK